MQSLNATVIDTNHRPRGVMPIKIDFDEIGPRRVEHDGRGFYFTGKEGTRFSDGRAVREMATERDARLWITLDGTEISEN